MLRSDLKKLSSLRLQDAEALLSKKSYAGAYYLSGFVVEFALKACIAKKTKKYEFPDKDLANRYYTHDLTKLLGFAGLDQEMEIEKDARSSVYGIWEIVRLWSPRARYNTGIGKAFAVDMIRALNDPVDGVYKWLEIRC